MASKLLTLLWLILILENVYRRVLVAIQNPPGFERTDNLTIVEIAVEIEHGLFTSFVLTASMVGYVVLAVVFMLAATRLGGLRYAFLLLGLLGLEQNFSFNSHLLTLSRHDFVPLWYFAPMSLHLLAQIGINVLMFRALTRLDTRAFTSITLIVGSLLLAVASWALWAGHGLLAYPLRPISRPVLLPFSVGCSCDAHRWADTGNRRAGARAALRAASSSPSALSRAVPSLKGEVGMIPLSHWEWGRE